MFKFTICTLFLVIFGFYSISVSAQRVSVKKCEEYKNLFREEFRDTIFTDVVDFGPVECPLFGSGSTIVGGRDAEAYEYPSMVSILYPDKNGGGLVSKCGGVLISEQFVLSAAHCFKSEQPKKVVLGELKVAPSALSTKRIELDIAQIISHPQYKPPASANDIALLKLARPLTLRYGVRQPIRPACLQQSEIPQNIFLNATGFGKTEAYGDAAKTLQTVALPTVPLADCSDFYRDALDFAHRFPGVPDQDSWVLPSTTLCAGGIEGKDTCQGDSGGPLFYSPDSNLECHRYVVGVTSFGEKFCGSRTPGVYTKISAYIPWIESQVWPSGK